ncbi:MAG: hypothetical protein R6V50_02205 [Thermoplasmatota archaeon]
MDNNPATSGISMNRYEELEWQLLEDQYKELEWKLLEDRYEEIEIDYIMTWYMMPFLAFLSGLIYIPYKIYKFIVGLFHE